MLVLVRDGEMLLELRPPAGIWGGLWSLPEISPGADIVAECKTRYGLKIKNAKALPAIKHGFTHFTLDIQPVLCKVAGMPTSIGEPGYRWLRGREIAEAALPAPVKKLLMSLRFV
jgi:A/G-specific adenine glycosylase